MELKLVDFSEKNIFDYFLPVGSLKVFEKQSGIKLKKKFFSEKYLAEYGKKGIFVYQYSGDCAKLVTTNQVNENEQIKVFFLISEGDFIIYDKCESKILCVINNQRGIAL